MADILLDALTNDLALDNGDLTLTSSVGELARQKVSINLNTFMGEWVYNVLAGIPYLRREGQPVKLLGASSKEFLDRYIIEGITTRDGVDSLETYDSSFDKVTGVVSINFVAIVEGDTVEVNDLQLII